MQAGKPAPQCFLDRYALGGDATHLTGTDPDARTLRHLLSRVLDGRPVDLVHAHGTGTDLNDPTELAAIESALAAIAPADAADRPRPHLYSHKGALGHSLGAAGLVSVVLNWAAHRTGIVPPNVQTRQPLPAGGVWIERGLVRRPIRRSVALAAGFGGPTAVVGLASGLAHSLAGGDSGDFPAAGPEIG